MVSIDRQVLACRMQCTARTDAVHCRGGCSALRERLQCTASEMEKTGTEKVSPILYKKLGSKDGSTRDTLGLPQEISAKSHYHHPSVFTMAFMTHTIPSPVSFQYHCGTNQNRYWQKRFGAYIFSWRLASFHSSSISARVISLSSRPISLAFCSTYPKRRINF